MEEGKTDVLSIVVRMKYYVRAKMNVGASFVATYADGRVEIWEATGKRAETKKERKEFILANIKNALENLRSDDADNRILIFSDVADRLSELEPERLAPHRGVDRY